MPWAASFWHTLSSLRLTRVRRQPETPRHLLVGGQRGRRPTVAAQRRLGDRHDQPQLIGGHRDTARRWCRRMLGGSTLGRGDERRIGHEDRELVGGRAGGEPHHRVLEHERQHRARREEGLEPARRRRTPWRSAGCRRWRAARRPAAAVTLRKWRWRWRLPSSRTRSASRPIVNGCRSMGAVSPQKSM